MQRLPSRLAPRSAMQILLLALAVFLRPVRATSDGAFECLLQPLAGFAGTENCFSMTKCYLDYLGEPTTPGEWWLAYASAVTEYCAALSSDKAACSNETGLCSLTYIVPRGTNQRRPMELDDVLWHDKVFGELPPFECWPNWEKIIRHPCIGCKCYQMFRCAYTKERGACNALGYCAYWPGTVPPSYCWPKWLLDDMLKNTRAYDEYTYAYYGRCWNIHAIQDSLLPRNILVDYYYNGMNSTELDCTFWAPYKGTASDDVCAHRRVLNSFLESVQARQALATPAGDTSLLSNLSVPYLPATLDDWYPLYDNQHDWFDAIHWYDGMWPYYYCDRRDSWISSDWMSSSCSVADVEEYSAALLGLHKLLSTPWSSLQSLVEPQSTWRAKLSAAARVCSGNSSNVQSPGGSVAVNNASCGDQHSNQTAAKIMQILLQYCDKALKNSTCIAAAASYMSRVYACKDSSSDGATARLALGAMWVAYGAALLLATIVLEVLWAFPQILTTCGSTKLRWLRRMLERKPVRYHPQHTLLRSCVARPWRRLASRVHRLVLVVAYIADITLDIWAMTAMLHLSSQYAAIGTFAAHYGGFLLLAFVAQFAVGAFFLTPAVAVTLGLLDYSWFKMSPRTRIIWFLPPVWVMFFVIVGCVVAFVFLVGIWYLLLSDVNMLLTLLGAPPKWLLGNKLNMEAVVALRFMCEGIIEALPSTLISTAVINSQLARNQPLGRAYVVFWLNLVSSLVRVAKEVYNLLRLTHDLHARCCITALVDICYHLHPQTSQLPTSTLPTPSLTACDAQQMTGIGTDAGASSNSASSDVADAPTYQQQQLADEHHSGCCFCGSRVGRNVSKHPKALTVYVWIVTLCVVAYIVLVALSLICPPLLDPYSLYFNPAKRSVCGSMDGLIAVWSHLRPDIDTPNSAAACLVEM